MLDLPKKIYIEPTNFCNLSCVMCPNSISTRKKGHMEFDLFCKCVDQLASTSRINIYHSGEPLLHPRIVDMVAYVNRIPHINTAIATNAKKLDKELSKNIVSAGLKTIIFSLDALDKTIYEKIRRGADYDHVFANLLNFLEVRKTINPNVQVVVDLIKLDAYDQDMDRYANELFLLGVDVVRIKKYLNWINLKPERNRVADNQGKMCRFPFTTLLILWDGTVIPCCPDTNAEYNCGNANESSLLEIWNGDQLNRLRSLCNNRMLHTLSPCKNCLDVDTFEQPYQHIYRSTT